MILAHWSLQWNISLIGQLYFCTLPSLVSRSNLCADTIKVKMQTFPQLYPNLSLCLRTTLKNEGVVRGKRWSTIQLPASGTCIATSNYCTPQSHQWYPYQQYQQQQHLQKTQVSSTFAFIELFRHL